MSLSKKQREFTKCVSHLLNFANSKGYEFTLGDAYRDPRVHGEFGDNKSYSHRNSVHKLRLAIDLNLFLDDRYVTDGSEPEYIELGNYWKSLHPDARWGGDFKDANHFSFGHWGTK